MESFDEFSNNLLEESKHFLEKAKFDSNQVAINAYLHSSLLLAISSLEAYVNSISDEFKDTSTFNLLEQGFLLEKDINFKNGEFKLSKRLKISRLLERIELIFNKFDKSKLNKKSSWWSRLNEGILLRNSLVHPKEFTELSIDQIELTLKAVIDCVDNLFLAVYKAGLPKSNMGLDSKLNF